MKGTIYVVASELSPKRVIDDALGEIEVKGEFEIFLNRPPKVTNLVVLYPATGGVERRLVDWLDAITRIVVLWRKGWNSLPAALAIEAHLRSLGFPVTLAEARKFEAVEGMRPIRMATIGGVSDWILGPRPPHIDISPPEPVGEKPMEKALSLAREIEKSVYSLGLDGVAVNCFNLSKRWGFVPCVTLSVLNGRGIPAACEGDLMSLLAMILGRRILGVSGMMGNVSYYTRGNVVLAHCTAPSDWGVISYRTHFETGLPISPIVEGFRGPGLLASFIGGRFRIAEVEVLGRENEEYACRNQFLLRTPETFVPVGNHHVLFDGNAREFAESLVAMGYRADLFTL